jgi:hypothetical protein
MVRLGNWEEELVMRFVYRIVIGSFLSVCFFLFMVDLVIVIEKNSSCDIIFTVSTRYTPSLTFPFIVKYLEYNKLVTNQILFLIPMDDTHSSNILED